MSTYIEGNNDNQGVQCMHYLQEHQPFSSVNELNEVVGAHFERCNYQLNETDRDVLVLLSRYAVKYPGVAHLKIDTITKSVKKSGRTIQRSIRKLEELKIVERKPFTRKVSGGYGANLYIFLAPSVTSVLSPRDTATNPEPSKARTANSENESIILKSNKEPYSSNTYAQVPVTHYMKFKDHLKSLLGDEKSTKASKLYGIYRAQTSRLLKFSIHEDKIELFQVLSIQAITITCQAMKKKKIRNIFGYYDGVLRNLIDKAVFENVFMDYDVAVDIVIPGN